MRMKNTKMDKQDLINIAEKYINQSPENRIQEDVAISEHVIGLKLFDTPILAFAAADDVYFLKLKQQSAVGEHFMLPEEWLPAAKTVISIFLPFSAEVKNGNGRNMTWPSDEWLHARIEGQVLLNRLCLHLKSELIDAGYPSIVPSMDERFWSNGGSQDREAKFSSNWSERHIAFVCGHGTFGLSKGLITRKGIAGRFGSIVTELGLAPDVRDYTDLYEYCTMCGRCVNNCPVGAISREKGKDHKLCSDFLDETKARHNPRYACGKCQVRVPCESKIPRKYQEIK